MTARRLNVTGQRFGKLTAVRAVRDPDYRWLCRCDCGKTSRVVTDKLTSGRTKSCGCLQHRTPANFLDLTGKRFGRLVVREREPDGKGGLYHTAWRCRCDCGAATVVKSTNLVRSETMSCGCLRDILSHITNRKHGDAPRIKKAHEWQAWSGAHHRCSDMNDERYGKRGIRVCKRWDSYSTFLADMGRAPSRAHTIERKNNDGNYEPRNCRWAVWREQCNNRRTTRYVTAFGERGSLADMVRKYGVVSYGTVEARLLKGWTGKGALTTPPLAYPRKRTRR
jgi:hypothetical protein